METYSHISLIQKEHYKMKMIPILSKKVWEEPGTLIEADICVLMVSEKELHCCNYVHNLNCVLAEPDMKFFYVMIFYCLFKRWHFANSILGNGPNGRIAPPHSSKPTGMDKQIQVKSHRKKVTTRKDLFDYLTFFPSPNCDFYVTFSLWLYLLPATEQTGMSRLWIKTRFVIGSRTWKSFSST